MLSYGLAPWLEWSCLSNVSSLISGSDIWLLEELMIGIFDPMMSICWFLFRTSFSEIFEILSDVLCVPVTCLWSVVDIECSWLYRLS